MKKILLGKLLLALTLCLFFPLRVQASSYNYDDKLNPLLAPYAYSLATDLNLKTVMPVALQDKRIIFTGMANSASDANLNEVYLVGYLENTRAGVIFILDGNYNLKDYIMANVPLSPTALCYTSGNLYVGGGYDEKIFVHDLYNPLDKTELIASEYQLYTPAIESRINMIKGQLKDEALAAFNATVENVIRIERKIALFTRYHENTILPTFNYVKSFGLKTQEAKVLRTPFRPLKIASNEKNSCLYIISESSQMGLLAFKKDGTFMRFIGSNKIEMARIDKIWRKFIRDEVLDTKDKLIQNNFSSLAVDDKGFVYTTTSVAKQRQVQKFNAKGKNILLEDPNRPVIGDYYQKKGADVASSILQHVDVSTFGTYLLYCRSKHRLFSYNNTGELLFVQGEAGDNRLQFGDVVEMKFFHNDILLLEGTDSKAHLKVLKETAYGTLLNKASLNYHQGNFERSAQIYDDILKLNAHSDFAYVGRGKIYLINKEYQKACYYFKKARHGEYYAKSYQKYRSHKIAELFPLGLASLILLISLSVSIRKNFKHDK